MKALRNFVAGCLLTIIPAGVVLSQDISVTIKDIKADQEISGDVRGLTPKGYPSYKVIVYVHTDKWYIHPFSGQDEGKSWAAIADNGTWTIQTVKRDFNADKVAALVVNKTLDERSPIENIEKIPHSAITVKNLRGTPDYGKL